MSSKFIKKQINKHENYTKKNHNKNYTSRNINKLYILLI